MFAGVDLGSRFVKIAILDEAGNVDKLQQIDTAVFYRSFGRRYGDRLEIDTNALGLNGVECLGCTGYGRKGVATAGGRAVPEIRAHLLGAVHGTKLADFTLLDIGGQDSKVALVREGRILDFETNDRCAASTGRYLEHMAHVLGLDLATLASHHLDPAEISATCAIFAETEVVGRLAEGVPVTELAAGVNWAIFRRLKPMLARLFSPVVVFTGGLARGGALSHIIAAELGVRVRVPDEPAYAGAIGCCLAVMDAGKEFDRGGIK